MLFRSGSSAASGSSGQSGTGSGSSSGTTGNSYPVSLVMINEFGFYYDNSNGSTPRFLELYNGSSKDYDLKGHSLTFRIPGQATESVIMTFTQSTRLAAHGYYVVPGGSSVIPGGIPGGVFVLRKGDASSGTVLDAVAFGAASNPFFSTSSAANPFNTGGHGASAARRPNGTNTNNNQADFAFTTMPTPGAPNQ